MNERLTRRSDADASDTEPLVKFRLLDQGPLFASKGDAQGDQIARRSGHKHDIRRAFHKQLKRYWQVHPWLREETHGWSTFFPQLPQPQVRTDGVPEDAPDEAGTWRMTYLWENIAKAHEISGVQFVPLVCEQFKLLCELDILMLRRDRPGGIFSARDIDNRLKTLFDAFRMPKMIKAEFSDDERPYFVLLQDDSLITHVHVETDELLDPPPESGKDDSYVRLLISVKLHPYDANMFNLSFV